MGSWKISIVSTVFPGSEEERIRQLAAGQGRIYKYANDYGDKIVHTDYYTCKDSSEERALFRSPSVHNLVLVYDRGKTVSQQVTFRDTAEGGEVLGIEFLPKCGDSTSSTVGPVTLESLAEELKTQMMCVHGIELMDQGKLNEAVSEFLKAIEADPECEPAYGLLAATLIRQGKAGDAVKILEKRVAMSPHLEQVRRDLDLAREALPRGSHGNKKKRWWKFWG